MPLFLKIVAARRARESVKAAPQPQQQAQACIAKEIPDQAAITRASSWAGHLLQAVAPRWRDLHSRLQLPMRWDSAWTGFLGGEFAAAVQLGLPLDSQAHLFIKVTNMNLSGADKQDLINLNNLMFLQVHNQQCSIIRCQLGSIAYEVHLCDTT